MATARLQPKPAVTPPPPAENTTDLELPLQSVLENLPPQLRSRMRLASVDLTRATIAIALGKIMPQLALGVVKITFGELRHAAPGLFDVDQEYDSLPIVLPLNEVLARLSTNSLIRNPAQKHIEVPPDIAGPFSERGEGVSISAAAAKPLPASVPPMRMTTPTPTPVKASPPPVAPPPPAFVSRSIKPELPPQVPSLPHNGNGNGNGMPVQPIIPTIPFQPAAPAAPRPSPPAPRPMPVVPEPATILAPLAALAENWPEVLRAEIAQLIMTNAQVALPLNLVESALKRGRVIFAWRNLRSWIKPMPPTMSIHDGLELELPLKVVAPLFLAGQGGVAKTAKVHQQQQQHTPLPAEIPNLFFGFPQPQPPYEIPEPPARAPQPEEAPFAAKPAEAPRPDTNYYMWVESDTTRMTARPPETEFKSEPVPATDFSSRYATPKEVVAPLYLAGQAGPAKAAKAHQPAPLPAEIPNLFFGFPQPQPPYEIPEPTAKAPQPDDTRFAVKPAAEAPGPDTNYYMWVESDTTRMTARPHETEFKREAVPATDFSSRQTTPKEVVTRAMALNGVVGALVALPDGLTVASEIPSDLNADTLAAFLPQIYGRVSQCTRELRMGDLNNLNFTVGNVPWKVFRIHGVYFAAFGRAGEPLPTAQLALLAGELDRKKQ